MGFLAGLFGGGNNFNAQQSANLQNPYSAQDVQNQLAQYQQFANALGAQNGIGNQSNVFNQLQGVANGQGPNPAQAMLQQATGQNVANQAALMAGQRGTSANPGLLARQAAQQGGALQQNAIGQGASLQANQSLNALNQLGGIAGQQVQQQGGAMGNLLGTVGQGLQAQNANKVALTGQQAGLATQQGAQQGGLFGGALNALGQGISMLSEGGMAGASNASNQGAAMKEEDCGPSIVDHILGHWEGGYMKHGGKVAGRASMKGDSYKNDTVKAMLSPGEVVVPRSHTKSPEMAAKFAAAVVLRNNKK